MKRSHGFTLMELLIYAAILAVISVLAVNAILIMTKSFGGFKASRSLNVSARTVLERMIREIRLANGLSGGESVFDASPGRLVLNTVDQETENPATMEFFLENNAVKYRKNGVNPELLTSAETEVSRLIFRKIQNAPTSMAIKIEMTINAGQGVSQKTENFYGAAVLRRGY
ncbi:MAG: prepilin-type N-terminal cleavage/methylation domain-containing protein [Patescibacteria group bacterium]